MICERNVSRMQNARSSLKRVPDSQFMRMAMRNGPLAPKKDAAIFTCFATDTESQLIVRRVVALIWDPSSPPPPPSSLLSLGVILGLGLGHIRDLFNWKINTVYPRKDMVGYGWVLRGRKISWKLPKIQPQSFISVRVRDPNGGKYKKYKHLEPWTSGFHTRKFPYGSRLANTTLTSFCCFPRI